MVSWAFAQARVSVRYLITYTSLECPIDWFWADVLAVDVVVHPVVSGRWISKHCVEVWAHTSAVVLELSVAIARVQEWRTFTAAAVFVEVRCSLINNTRLGRVCANAIADVFIEGWRLRNPAAEINVLWADAVTKIRVKERNAGVGTRVG